MPMYWTFNCFLGCWYISSRDFQILNFDVRKKRTKLPELGSGGGGFGGFGKCPKENVFFLLMSSLICDLNQGIVLPNWMCFRNVQRDIQQCLDGHYNILPSPPSPLSSVSPPGHNWRGSALIWLILSLTPSYYHQAGAIWFNATNGFHIFSNDWFVYLFCCAA